MRVKNLCVKDYIVKGVKLEFSKNCWGEGISVGVWGITSLENSCLFYIFGMEKGLRPNSCLFSNTCKV